MRISRATIRVCRRVAVVSVASTFVSVVLAAQAPAPAAPVPAAPQSPGVVSTLPATGPQAPPAAAPAPPEDAVLNEARQAFDATNYERARQVLDTVLAGVGTAPSRPELRQVVIGAYELRARTRFNLRDEDGARTDFRALLLMEPSYLLSAQVGARVLTLFDEVKKTTVGTVNLVVQPVDAVVMLGDRRIASDVTALDLVGGMHTISATRSGYEPLTQSFAVVPGADPAVVNLTLRRVSSTITLITSPADIEVIVDGVSRGVTELDPAAKTEGGNLLSKAFTLTDVQNGRHRVEFRRECFVNTEQEFDVSQPGDFRLDPVRLAPAVATVAVTLADSNVAGAAVYVDDVPKGNAPLVMTDICHGSRTIEVRSKHGRHVRRMDLKPGQKEVFQARIRPAFAVISDSGALAGVRGGPDLKLAVENAFGDAVAITFFAPPEKRVAELFAEERLPVDWLAFDSLRKPMGQAVTIAEPARAKLGASLARALDAQGIAAVARDPGGDAADMLLILLAPGSAEPDVFRWRTDNPQSIRETLRLLDRTPQLYRHSIGALAIDVHDIDGAVITAVTPGTSGDRAGLKAGDIIVTAAGDPLTSIAQLNTIVDARQPGQALALEVQDTSGRRQLSVEVQAVPNVLSLTDQELPSNKLAVQHTYRAAHVSTALDEAAVRLNLAAVALRLKMRTEAVTEAERIIKTLLGDPTVAPLADPIGGTAQYLLGLAAEQLGDNPRAQTAFNVAAKSRGNLLIENGESLKQESEERLTRLLPVAR